MWGPGMKSQAQEARGLPDSGFVGGGVPHLFPHPFPTTALLIPTSQSKPHPTSLVLGRGAWVL